jgi:uncharacterized repeat protein (TIGR03847 family)
MARQVFLYENPERFISGTVGTPGERTFYLQVKKGNLVTSVALEKTQVSLLCERMDALIDQLMDKDGSSEMFIPENFDQNTIDLLPLESPVNEEFRVGTITIGYNATKELITIEAHEDSQGSDVPDLESNQTSGPDLLRIRISLQFARNFCERGRRLVAAGRPPCPFCQLPLDPKGHICPRANGYLRRK